MLNEVIILDIPRPFFCNPLRHLYHSVIGNEKENFSA
jgi:hypothetical protein